jgi:hypothetical protein
MMMVETDKWNFRSDPKRFLVTLVAVTVLCVLVGGALAYVAERADGATEEAAKADACGTYGVSCPVVKKKHRRSVRQFKGGKFQQASGFNPQKMFKKPKASRRIMVNRIHYALKDAKAKSATGSVEFSKASVCSDTSRMCAFEIYQNMAANSDCVDLVHSVYPTHESSTCWKPQTRPLTKKEVFAGGAAVFCGGSVAFGVSMAGASGGSTAFLAIWGASSCGWSFAGALAVD